MKRLGHLAAVRAISARILSAAHHSVVNNRECFTQINFLTNIDVERFVSISPETLEKFAESQHHIFTLAPLRSGCTKQTGLSVLNTAIETGQFENYRNSLNSYLNVTSETTPSTNEMSFQCQSLILTMHNLAQTDPHSAMIELMATQQEITKFAGFELFQIVRFTSAGINPFIFHEGTETEMLNALETKEFQNHHVGVERIRMCSLTSLI
ncbi:hypothetical protein [Vibrio crassostreae]|uniref:hypothetical protein n=1 Tax=Vibrio crassostreae TaxID=246167 RepID=UPI001B30295C|nr:hypothetical protein [Vibrio crassostreae]